MDKKILIFIFSFVVLLLLGVKFSGLVVQTQSSVNVINENYTPPVVITPTPISSVGGGGGGGVVEKIEDFYVENDLIKISLKQGGVDRESIKVVNSGNSDLNISIEIRNLNDFVSLDDKSLFVGAGQSKIVNLVFYSSEFQKSDVYVGKIIFNYGNISKIVDVVLEIKEMKPLFDIKTSLDKTRVYQGKKINANIEMTNMGDLQKVDVLLYYAIKDFDNSVVFSKEESLAVEKTLNITRSVDIPEDFVPGKYLFYSRVNYSNASASSSQVFEILNKEDLLKIQIIVGGSLIVLVFVIWYLLKVKKRML